MPNGYHLTRKGHYEPCVFVQASKSRVFMHKFVCVCDTKNKMQWHLTRLNNKCQKDKVYFSVDFLSDPGIWIIYKSKQR